jgi:hypothetical protein
MGIIGAVTGRKKIVSPRSRALIVAARRAAPVDPTELRPIASSNTSYVLVGSAEARRSFAAIALPASSIDTIAHTQGLFLLVPPLEPPRFNFVDLEEEEEEEEEVCDSSIILKSNGKLGNPCGIESPYKKAIPGPIGS